MWESRVLQRAFERLELHEGKLSRAVLRGGGGGDVTSLPDLGASNVSLLPDTKTAMIEKGGVIVQVGFARPRPVAVCWIRSLVGDLILSGGLADECFPDR